MLTNIAEELLMKSLKPTRLQAAETKTPINGTSINPSMTTKDLSCGLVKRAVSGNILMKQAP